LALLTDLTFDVEAVEDVLLALFFWLAEVEGGGGALAIEDGPWTFTEARGLRGYSNWLGDSQISQARLHGCTYHCSLRNLTLLMLSTLKRLR
jgi:hypothetical protein